MGISKQIEIEAKFALDDQDLATPDFTAIEGVDQVVSTTVHELSAVYYDTADLRLSDAKITLRRRTGGKDAGWHIKLPASTGRLEIHHDLAEGDEDTVPDALLSAVRAIVRTHELSPIARVDNVRHETLLGDAEGNVVAEFCDDHVSTSCFLPGGEDKSWREWEIEATAYAQEADLAASLISSATEVFLAAGAQQSSSPSKLVMALGDAKDNVPHAAQLAALDEDAPAYAVLHALKRNRDKLIEFDPKVRRDEWDSVHQMRVATRELRSHMQTFEGILTGDAYTQLESDLKLLARVLGRARDAEVIAERFLALLEGEQTGSLDEATIQHLREDMNKKYKVEHSRVVKALDNPKYLAMLDSLDDVLCNPPLADLSHEDEDTHEVKDSDAILAEHLGKAYDKLVRRHEFATEGWEDSSLSLHEREDRFHSMRKAAKKLRYSAEAIGDATDLKTGKLYAACKNMQEVLGDFQDAVTSRDKLRGFAKKAHARGEDTFGYGVLFQHEHQLALNALDEYAAAYKAIVKAYRKLNKHVQEQLEEKAEQRRKEEKKAARKARKKEEKRLKKERKLRKLAEKDSSKED